MENNYISNPSNIEGGNSVDFRKTFDLNGKNNDQMLRLFLRKAGLSDEIECLTVEQRRAFIYDIIKSNKNPGHWKPSTMKTANCAVRPPSPLPEKYLLSTSHKPHQLKYATMSTSCSSGSIKSFPHSSSALDQPSTFVDNNKGSSKMEISSPINFQHVSGDMTRDMTRNAFDLSLTMSDNVIKKYMIERGITEANVANMRKEDIIRNIVQSKFTWMPRNNETSPSPSSSTDLLPPPSPSASNYANVILRFVDSSEFPSPESLYSKYNEPASEHHVLPAVTITNQTKPTPPPRKTSLTKKSFAPLTHPSTLTVSQNGPVMGLPLKVESNFTPLTTSLRFLPQSSAYESSLLPPPPLLLTVIPAGPSHTTVLQIPTTKYSCLPISFEQTSSDSYPLPPPEPTALSQSLPFKTTSRAEGDSRHALLASIRNGVTLKKVEKKLANISSLPERKPSSAKNFVSELKITLRRVKNFEDEPDETDA